jgi:hypothetical protein
MNLSQHDIDWIVAEVVRRIKQLGDQGPAGEATTIADRVITLESIKNLPNNVRQIIVTPKAIVTPAARDELKHRNVRLLRQGEAGANKQANTNQLAGTTLLATNLAADYQPLSLAQLMSAYGAGVQHHPASALPGIVASESQRVVNEAKKAVWFTSQPAHAVCLANRHAGVWAVQATVENDVASAMNTIAANVLVINPQGKSQYALRKMIDAFVAH